LFSVESVVREEGKAILLLAQPVPAMEGSATIIDRDSVLAKALLQGVTGRFRAELIPSVKNPGKFQASIHGAPIGEFDTQNEATGFLRGFT
jgi:hypothetical protein